jgi:hypothetical protein
MVTSQFTTSTNSISLNGGTTISGGAPAFTAGTTTYLGVDTTTSAYYYIGLAMEIIFYNSILNTTQRQQVEGYLAWKWSLQANLPSTHPYKNSLIPPLLNPPRALPVVRTATWNPTLISGCQLWLDAADRSVFTLSGSNITEWRDKSGNARTATQYNTGFATYDSIQRRVVIIPLGQLSSAVSAGTFSAGVSAFIVFQKFGANLSFDTLVNRTNDNGPFPGPFDSYYNAGASTLSRLIGEGGNDNRAGFSDNSTLFRNTTITLYHFNIPAVVVWNEGVNGSIPVRIPQNETVGTPRYSDVGNRIYIGTRGDKFTTANVYMYEIIFYNTTLSTNQRQNVEGYLAWKWGLVASLPANHPFKLWPPPP